MKKSTRLVALLGVAALAFTACASDGGTGGGTTTGGPQAGACAATELKGFALGGAPVGGVSAAGAVKGLQAQSQQTVKIGMFGDLSGDNSGLVIPIRNAGQLAVDQANERGDLKVRVQFVAKDNKNASLDTAPAIEQSFIDDDQVVGVMGGAFSGETLAVGNLFEEAGLTHITPSATNPEITQKGWPVFRALSTDDIQGAKAAKALSAMGCKNIAVIDDKSDYGKGLADFVASSAQQEGLDVQVREGVEATTTDYTPLIQTLQSEQPQAVFYGGYYSAGSLILKQMREAGLNALFMCGDGCKDDNFVKGAGAENANGTVFSCPCLDPNVSEDPKAQEFAQAYEKEFGNKPAIYASEAYDVVNIFIHAIDQADEDGQVTRKEIFDAVKGISDFQGITKTFNWTETGEVEGGAINIYAVKDGEIKLLGETDEVAA